MALSWLLHVCNHCLYLTLATLTLFCSDNRNGRVLGFQVPDSTANTIEICISECADRGYTVAGTEFGVQCFCDNNIINGGSIADSDAECNMGCAANAE